MAKTSGLGDQCFIGGYDLSGDVGSLSKIGGGIAVLDVTSINKSAHERISGLRDGALTFNTFFNTAAGQEHPALSTLPTTDVIVSYFRGGAVGNPAASMVAKQVDYNPTRATGGSLTVAVNTLANGYGLEWGQQLTPGSFTSSSALTGNASTFEGGISTWVAASNCTIAQTAAQAHGGTKSLGITSVASGDMTAEHVTDSPNGLGGIAVLPAASYLVSGWFRSAVSARTCGLQVNWYDNTGSYISTTTGSTITSSTSAWTQASSAHTAPATAAFAIVLAKVTATGGAAEVHYLDDVLFLPSPASLDNGSSSAFGLQAYLQVFAFTGTDATVTLQHSTDNATFANVTSGAFSQITAANTTQRIATSNSATINRYLRVQITTSAGYSFLSFAVQVTRNALAGQVF